MFTKKLNREYEESLDLATEVNNQIAELMMYQPLYSRNWSRKSLNTRTQNLKQQSAKTKFKKARYKQLITAMKNTESKIQSVLAVFNGRACILSNYLNAQAISPHKNALSILQSDDS